MELVRVTEDKEGKGSGKESKSGTEGKRRGN